MILFLSYAGLEVGWTVGARLASSFYADRLAAIHLVMCSFNATQQKRESNPRSETEKCFAYIIQHQTFYPLSSVKTFN